MNTERQERWEIVVGGRELKWSEDKISYEQAISEWNRLRGDQPTIGLPPIKYKRLDGETGTLRQGGSVKVEDGFEIKIDPSHLS